MKGWLCTSSAVLSVGGVTAAATLFWAETAAAFEARGSASSPMIAADSSGSAFIGLALFVGVYVVIAAIRILSPFALDPSDLAVLRGGRKTYSVQTRTGAVTNATKLAITEISGDATASAQIYQGSGTVNLTNTIRPRTRMRDQFFLTDPSGQSQAFRLEGVDLVIGDGQLVSAVWAIPNGKDRGDYLLFRNHSTNQTTFIDRALLKIALGFKHPYIGVWMFWILLVLGGLPYALVGLAFNVAFFIIASRQKAAQFRRSGTARLIAALDEQAARPPVVAGQTRADELTKLAELAREGLLSDEEWTRAKEMYLGKPPNARTDAVQRLRQIYQLFKDNVLSESEFNTKKWEILSRDSRTGG